jgi:hypothetical protein
VVIADRKFIAALDKFSANAALAADCVAAFGGIPAPVAKAVLRSLESAQASLRSLLQASGAGSERVN